jgi:hypothetical protein
MMAGKALFRAGCFIALLGGRFLVNVQLANGEAGFYVSGSEGHPRHARMMRGQDAGGLFPGVVPG